MGKSSMMKSMLIMLCLSAGTAMARQIGGLVYEDVNFNGVMDPGTEAPVAGVTATLFLETGSVVSAISDASGVWTANVTDNQAIRLEYSNFPAGYAPSLRGADSASSVVFLAGGSSDVGNLRFAVANPDNFCDENPDVVLTCYITGPQAGLTNDTVVLFNYTNRNDDAHDTVSTAGEVGAVFGTAYQSASDIIYLAAFQKRHSGYGPLGPGGVYLVDRTNASVTNSFDLYSLFPDAAASDPHPTSTTYDESWLRDPNSWDAVGKVGLGDLDLSSDDSTLYVVNLVDRRLYEVDVTDPGKTFTSSDMSRYDIPRPAGNCPDVESNFRPFATKYHQGKVYVGAICSAETTQDRSDMHGYVYEFDTVTKTFNPTPVLQWPLAYPRGNAYVGPTGGVIPADWNPWTNGFATITGAVNQNFGFANVGYPQAMFVDIEIDCEGDMIIGMRDRASDQFGFNTLNPFDTSDTFEYKGYGAGDLLRASAVGNGNWSMENNSIAGANGPTAGANNGQGPGNGEFYHADSFSDPIFQETVLGGLIYKPCDDKILVAVSDPIDSGDVTADTDSAGVRWFSNTNGASCGELRIFDNTSVGGTGAGTFGKVNGLGDLELLCPPAPIEAGNYVWLDENRNGVQDPGEAPISGVTVELRDANHNPISSTITDANGEYYFTGLDGLGFFGDYSICINMGQGPLALLALSNPDYNNNNGNSDLNDSDAVISNVNGTVYAKIPFNAGGPGTINHSLDVGFFPPPTDFGDLPAGYNKTTLSDGGAGHILVDGVFLGSGIDAEMDGQESILADGDGPDDNGILFLDSLKPGGTVEVQITASVAGFLNGWIDWQANNVLDDQSANRIAADLPVPAGTSTLTVNIPVNATLNSDTGARFRFTTASGTLATTPCDRAPDGEVEDYLVRITADPAIELNKTVYLGNNSGTGCASAGDLETGATGAAVTYCFEVENTGDCALNSITVDDQTLNIGRGSMTLLSGSEPLAPGETMVFYYDTTINGPLTNVATSCGDPSTSNGVDIPTLDLMKDSDIAIVLVADPEMEMIKTVYKGHNNGSGCATAPDFVGDVNGTEITYCFTIVNSGDTFLSNLLFDDPTLSINQNALNLVTGTLPLAPGESISYFYQTTLTQSRVNTACAELEVTAANGQVIDSFDSLESCDTAEVALQEVSLGDYVWFDNNNDGQQGPASEEPGVAGATVLLTACNGTPISSAVTAADGSYSFDNLPLGSYKVQLDLNSIPGAYRLTESNQGSDQTDSDADEDGCSPCVTLNQNGQRNETIDFGIFSTVSVGDCVWEDSNINGIKEPGEAPVPGVTVHLKSVGDAILETTTTGQDGTYLFTDLPPGNYRVCFVVPTDCKVTVQGVGDPTTSSKADENGETVFTGPLEGGEFNLNLDMGIYKLACLGDTVWEDLNFDGNPSNDVITTTGLPGVEVILCQIINGSETEVQRTVTQSRIDNAGYYEFCDLEPGEYCVKLNEATIPAQFVKTSTAVKQCVTLSSGEFNQTLDFGFSANPTAIVISDASATIEGNTVNYSFTTASESEALLFDVIRIDAAGNESIVNPAPILAENNLHGSTYEVTETGVPNGVYTYVVRETTISLRHNDYETIVISVGGSDIERGLHFVETANADTQDLQVDGQTVASLAVDGGLACFIAQPGSEVSLTAASAPTRMQTADAITEGENTASFVLIGDSRLFDVTDSNNPVLLIGVVLEDGLTYYHYSTEADFFVDE